MTYSKLALQLLCPAPNRRGIKRCFCLTSDACLSDVCLSVAYIGPKSRIERPRKTKIGTQRAHVTRDSDITFKVKSLKCQRSRTPGRFGWLFKSLHNLYGRHQFLRHRPDRVAACRSWIFMELAAAGVRRVWAGVWLHRAACRGGGILRDFRYSLFRYKIRSILQFVKHNSWPFLYSVCSYVEFSAPA